MQKQTTLADIKKKNRQQPEFTYGTGCMPSKMDGTEHEISVDDKIELPEEFNWQDSMPPVRDQGMSTTCVCQSLTGCLDFLYNSRNNVSKICNGFSIDELYSIRTNKTAPGMTFKEALKYLRHHGLNGEKINSYAKLPSVQATKYAIVMFGPVVGGFPVYTAEPSFWRKPGRFQGGHAVTIVGYNKDGFIIRNSWGTDWADDGHCVISYEEFMQNCFEAWTITL